MYMNIIQWRNLEHNFVAKGFSIQNLYDTEMVSVVKMLYKKILSTTMFSTSTGFGDNSFLNGVTLPQFHNCNK